ncbi:MAG: tetratricopeptide (TPR) repeat protein [Candidatus Pseudothioglobus sp.]|jgi:tetratricopeptide (TPR) repeat protein
MNKFFFATVTVVALLASPVFADKIDAAQTAFEVGDSVTAELNYQAAIGLDRKNASAYLGLGRLYLAGGQFDKSAEAIKSGLKYTKSKLEKLDLLATSIRLENTRGDYKKAKSYYNKAKRIRGAETHAEIHVAMANTAIATQKFKDAEKLLKTALTIESPFTAEAVETLENMQLIEKALVITDSEFAYSSSITRAQVAYLLTHQLQIQAEIDTSASTESTIGEMSDQGLIDYFDSDYRDAIVQVHRLGLRSMRIKNGAFQPNSAFTRVELALLIEDVLHAKFDVSRTQFIGTDSPFSDLSSNHTGFNAMMTSVTRGLMQGNQDGVISPDALVSGAEAILVLHNLESILNKKS